MKRVILIVFLFFNLLPVIEKGQWGLSGPIAGYSQTNGEEDDEYWDEYMDDYFEDTEPSFNDDIAYSVELPEINITGTPTSGEVSASITLPTVYVGGPSNGGDFLSSVDWGSMGITMDPVTFYNYDNHILPTITITASSTSGMDNLLMFYSIIDSYNANYYTQWQNEYNQNPTYTSPPPPTPPVPISPNNPCNAIAQSAGANTSAIINKSEIQTQISNLAPITETSDEQGFSIRKNSDGSYTASDIQTVGPSGGTISNFLNSEADFHTHPKDGPPSARDIFRLDALHDQIPGFKTSYTQGSSGSKYAITITDEAKFNAFVNANPSSVGSDHGFDPNSELGIKFYEARQALVNVGYSAAEANERATALILKDSGVTLLKAPSGSNDFKKIGMVEKKNADGTPATDANGNKIYEKADCPR